MHISNVHNLWDVTLRVCYEIHDFRLFVAIKVLKFFLIALSNQTLQLL